MATNFFIFLKLNGFKFLFFLRLTALVVLGISKQMPEIKEIFVGGGKRRMSRRIGYLYRRIAQLNLFFGSPTPVLPIIFFHNRIFTAKSETF